MNYMETHLMKVMKNNRFTLISWIIIFVLLALLHFLSACSPTKKLQRLYKKHPELFEDKIIIDTIKYQDTIAHTIKGSEVDTSFHISMLSDTATIQDSLFTATIYYDTILDTVYIRVDVPARKIYIPYEVELPCNTHIYKRPRDALIWWWNSKRVLQYMFFAMVIVIVLYFLKGNK